MIGCMVDKSVIYGLYCLCHPGDGIRYVGQTVKGMNARFGVHLWSSKTSRSPLYNWIRKHGSENIFYEILEICTPDDINDREIFWISYYRDAGARLTNVLDGGQQGWLGQKRPDHSVNMTGNKNPMFGSERKAVMAHARSFQRPITDETRRKLSESHTGLKHSEESKKLMSESAKLSWDADRRAAASESNSGSKNAAAKFTEDDVRSIRLRKLAGESYYAIAKEHGVNSNTISFMCRRKTWAHVE